MAMSSRADLQQLESRLARKSRWIALWSLVGAAIVLAALVYGSLQLAQVEKKRNAALAELAGIQQKLATDKQALADTDQQLKERTTELEIANKAYQQLSGYVPAGTAEAAVQRATAATPGQSALVPLIYMQIAREDQRAFATQIADKLRAAGYQVPKGIEYVGDKAPSHSQLRYFLSNDNDKGMDDLIALLKSWGVDAAPQYIGGAAKLRVLRPKQFELWFGRDFQVAAQK